MDLELDADLDLVLSREINAPRDLLWRCWTTPEHLVRWFVPKPHKVIACKLDLRPGEACNTTFDVEGNIMEDEGVCLQVIPMEKLVLTDAYSAGWKPAPESFMAAIVMLNDFGAGRTKYTAIARHRSPEMATAHKNMGLFDGWGTVATQLETYAQKLK